MTDDTQCPQWNGNRIVSGMSAALTRVSILVCLTVIAGCSRQPRPLVPPVDSTPHERSFSVETDGSPNARAADYSRSLTSTLGFDSPESVTRVLEQRWSLADIRRFCIPARRHNPLYQNLVVMTPEEWKGRLYSDQRTGFDGICWYASVRDGKLLEYSLGVYRHNDYWLLEIGSPESIQTPPEVTPDPSAEHFVGHK